MKESRPIYHTTAVAWITAMVLLLLCSILSQMDLGRPYRVIRTDRTEARAGQTTMVRDGVAAFTTFAHH